MPKFPKTKLLTEIGNIFSGGPCCYPTSGGNPECMWNAFHRLAGFDIGEVFEISTGYLTKHDGTDGIWARDPVITNDRAMYGNQGWMNSQGHYEVILGSGQWYNLRKVGCYAYQQYASLLNKHNLNKTIKTLFSIFASLHFCSQVMATCIDRKNQL